MSAIEAEPSSANSSPPWWRDALTTPDPDKSVYRYLRQCQALLIVLTPDWLASKWCFAEFALARMQGKAVFVAKTKPHQGGSVIPALQEVDLTTDRDAALAKLARGLKEQGLDPRDAFDWDPERPIYPGLIPAHRSLNL